MIFCLKTVTLLEQRIVKFPCRQPTGDRHFVVNGSEYTRVRPQDSVKENGGRADGN